MTARDIWRQCYRYQRMTQCEESWQNVLLHKALARMPSRVLTGEWAVQAISHRHDLLLRRMVVGLKTLPDTIPVYGKPSGLSLKPSDFKGEEP